MLHQETIKSFVVETPVGTLSFDASAQEGDIQASQIQSCDIEPNLPQGMSVDGCFAVLFRCTSTNPINDLMFRCCWKNLEAKGYGNSGEALDAWEWEHNQTLITIGTEDNEWLSQRTQQIKVATAPEDYPVSMQNNCIAIKIAHYPKNKELTLHYVVAWNSLPEKTECSSWYAVDIPHKEIILACK